MKLLKKFVMVNREENRALSFNKIYLDEATQEQVNSSVSTNDIIEDTQSNQGDINHQG